MRSAKQSVPESSSVPIVSIDESPLSKSTDLVKKLIDDPIGSSEIPVPDGLDKTPMSKPTEVESEVPSAVHWGPMKTTPF